MNDYEVGKTPIIDAYGSLALALAGAVICIYAWIGTSKIYYLLGGIGFAVVSPIWFHAPIKFKAFFFGPLNGQVTYHTEFSATHTLLSFVGYAILLAAVCLGLYEEWFA